MHLFSAILFHAHSDGHNSSTQLLFATFLSAPRGLIVLLQKRTGLNVTVTLLLSKKEGEGMCIAQMIIHARYALMLCPVLDHTLS